MHKPDPQTVGVWTSRLSRRSCRNRSDLPLHSSQWSENDCPRLLCPHRAYPSVRQIWFHPHSGHRKGRTFLCTLVEVTTTTMEGIWRDASESCGGCKSLGSVRRGGKRGTSRNTASTVVRVEALFHWKPVVETFLIRKDSLYLVANVLYSYSVIFNASCV